MFVHVCVTYIVSNLKKEFIILNRGKVWRDILKVKYNEKKELSVYNQVTY